MAFTNPITAAAHIATQLGQHLDLVLVHARAADRWAFVAWRRPDLVLACVRGNTWRHCRIDGRCRAEECPSVSQAAARAR